MLQIKSLLLLFIFCVFFSCNKNSKKLLKIDSNYKISKRITDLSKLDKETWFLKDVFLDSIPGISLHRAYDSLLVINEPQKIIVAVIDSEIDINHKDLKHNIWINQNEILDNGIDDDQNGYIDDTKGWNFLGNLNEENNTFTSYSYTRILKKFSKKYGKQESLVVSDSTEYKNYLRARKKYNSQLEYAKEEVEYANMLETSLTNSEKHLQSYFPEKNYNVDSLDSLKNTYLEDKELQKTILIKSNFIKFGFSREYIDDYKLKADERVNKLLNLSYNDREIIGDNIEDINDINYGNQYVNKNIDVFKHGTEIAGTILSVNRNNVEIMPICISPFGDETDKDIAVAIKYAVDNGAKIINMSFGKEFSIHKEWVFSAIKYAEKHNVLIVSSAGNYGYDLNKNNNYYPNDNIDNGKQVSDNFLLVGGLSNSLDEDLIYENSNHGNIDVDLFAPAVNIYTSFPNDKNDYDTGTSLASAISAGAATIIYQNYPRLSVSQIKSILMDSGLSLDINVKIPFKKDKLYPINTLSKSGKILNIYNALVMADSISKR